MSKAIQEMSRTELRDYERTLWATYHDLPMATPEDAADVGRVIRLIGRVQHRRKELRGGTTHSCRPEFATD